MVKLQKTKSILHGIIFKNVRISHPFLSVPSKDMNNDKLIYTTKILIPKATDLNLLKEVMKEVREDRWGDELPAKLRMPLMDGDKQEERDTFDDNFKGHWYANIKTSSERPPILISQNGNRYANLTDAGGVFYGGCYVNITANLWSYPGKGKKPVSPGKGISLGLIGVQFVDAAERFGGGHYNEEEFLSEFVEDGEADVTEQAAQPVKTINAETINANSGEDDLPW